jgi:hypothetical protein
MLELLKEWKFPFRLDNVAGVPIARATAGGDLAERKYLIVVGVIVAAIAADMTLNASAGSLFLVKKLISLVEFLEFWR